MATRAPRNPLALTPSKGPPAPLIPPLPYRRPPHPFALSLSKPVLRALEGGPPPPAAPASPHIPHTPHAAHHPDTALLPPPQSLRYRLPMEVAISHRNQNNTGPHAVGSASPIVGGMVRIEAQRGLVKQQGRLLPLCKKILGFVANLHQTSYKSIAKTTSRSRSVCIPVEAAIQAPAAQRSPSGSPASARSPRLRHTRGRAKLCPAKTTEVTSCMKD